MNFTINPKFQPRYWQSEQTDACINILWGKGNPIIENDRLVRHVPTDQVVLVLPTGGGKTYIAAMIAQRFLSRFPDKSVLICVHRDKLVDGMRNACHTAILADNRPLIATVIDADTKRLRPAPVYVAMVKTLNNRIKKAQKIKEDHGFDSDFTKLFDSVDLIIYDEAHRGEHGQVEKLFDGHCKKIGFTATPIRATKKDPLKAHYKDKEGNGCIVTYWKNGEWITGPQISELVEWNRTHPAEGLCEEMPITRQDDLSDSEKKAMISHGKVDDDMQGRMLKKPKFVEKVIEQYYLVQDTLTNYYGADLPTRRGICFHASIEHSKVVCERFTADNIPSMHVDGTTPDNERESIFKWFESTPNAVLHNVGIATTGFDFPPAIFILLNKYTISLPEFLQCLGRGGRSCIIGNWIKRIWISVDMHNSHDVHGHWHWNRDWRTLFLYPKRPGNGVAPMKDCPQCEGIVAASKRVCDQMDYDADLNLYFPCNFIFPIRAIPEPEMVTFKLSCALPPEKIKEWQQYLIENTRTNNIFGALNDMLRDPVDKYYDMVRESADVQMSEQICQELIDTAMQHAQVWKSVNGKKGGEWLVNRVKKTVKGRIGELWPGSIKNEFLILER